jgi:hypothetical protein
MVETPTAREKQQARVKVLWDQLGELHREAGIEERMEKALNAPIWPDFSIRFGSAESRERDQQERALAQRWERRKTREAYFGVTDTQLRKRLIDLYLKHDSAVLDYWRADNSEAHARFRRAQTERAPWVVGAIAGAVTLVVVCYLAGVRWQGHSEWGVPGSVCGAVIGLILALRARDEASLQDQRSLADATENLTADDRLFQSVLDDPPMFTAWEASSGEPAQ